MTSAPATAIAAAPLTPAMREVLERMRRAAHPPLHTLTPVQARMAYELGAGVLELPAAALARVQDLQIPARDGASLHARLYANSASNSTAQLPVLLYFHGGGFVIGSVNSHDVLCRELARLSGVAVLSLDYRLAPEHPFPIPVNDAWDTLLWLTHHASELGLDSQRISVGGDSAGGNLAAVCALLARDAGLKLTLQLLFYPACAPGTVGRVRYNQGLLLDQASMAYFDHHYRQGGILATDDWRAAPLLAPSHRDLAPVWMGLAQCDPLTEEGMAYAQRLMAQGVPTQVQLYRGVTHEFIKMGRFIPEAVQAHADAALALRTAWGL